MQLFLSRILNTHSYSTTRVGYVCSSSSSIATTTQGEVQLIWCCSDLEVAWERALFLYSAAVLWNGLPASMKTFFSLVSFKTALKKWLSSRQS